KPKKLKTSKCSALRSRRGRAQAEQFGSVTRRFPRAVMAIEAFSPKVFIHTRRIIMVPGHQHLLGFLSPLLESHRRLLSFSTARPRLWPVVWQAIRIFSSSQTASRQVLI